MDPARLNDLRLRLDSGVPVSNEEILEGLRAIRTDRTARALSADTRASKAAKVSSRVTIDLKALIANKTTQANK
jgi:hypothetical protein